MRKIISLIISFILCISMLNGTWSQTYATDTGTDDGTLVTTVTPSEESTEPSEASDENESTNANENTETNESSDSEEVTIEEKKVTEEASEEEESDEVFSFKANYLTASPAPSDETTSTFEKAFPIYKDYSDEMETIKADKKWTGDASYNRPDSITLSLKLDGKVLETLTLTADNDWSGTFKGSYPAYKLNDDGTFALDDEGNKILLEYTVEEDSVSNYKPTYSYSMGQSVVDQNNVHLFVPATSLEDGEQYLIVGGNTVGTEKVYRAEAYQTENVLTSDIQVLSSTIKDADGNKYDNYILLADDGTYDGLLWNSFSADSDSYYMFSNVDEIWQECHGVLDISSKDKIQTKHVGTYGSEYSGNVSSQGFKKVSDDSIGNAYKTEDGSTILYFYKEVTLPSNAFNSWQETATVTNRYDPPTSSGSTQDATFDLDVNKEWEKDTEDDRPDSIDVYLYKNGEKTNQKITLTEDENGNWSGSFQNLRVYDENGKKISYSVKEEVPDGYIASYEYNNMDMSEDGGTPIYYWVRTNELVDGETYLIVTSPDAGNVVGMEIDDDLESGFAWTTGDGAGTITVNSGPLTVNGVTYTTYITDKEASEHTKMQWKAKFEAEEKAQGQDIGYHAFYSLNNVAAIENGKAEGKDQYAYAKVNGNGDVWTESGAPQECWFYYGLNYTTDSSGKYIALDEQGNAQRTPTVENYPTDFSYVLGNYKHYFLLTNNHTGDGGSTTADTFYLYKRIKVSNPSVTISNTKSEKTKLTVYKNWVESDGSTKEHDPITVTLYKNGEPYTDKDGKKVTVELNKDNKWTYDFDDLVKYDEDGKEIKYTAVEENVPDGYTSSVVNGTVETSEDTTTTYEAWVQVTTLEAEHEYILVNANEGTTSTIGVDSNKTTLTGTNVVIYNDKELTDEDGNTYISYIPVNEVSSVTIWKAEEATTSGYVKLTPDGTNYFVKGSGNLTTKDSEAAQLAYDSENSILMAYQKNGTKYMASNGDFNANDVSTAKNTYIYEKKTFENVETTTEDKQVSVITNTQDNPNIVMPESGNNSVKNIWLIGFSLISIGILILIQFRRKERN